MAPPRNRPLSACPLAAAAPAAAGTSRAPTVTIDQALASNVQDAYFDYDKTDIRSDASATLSKNAAALKTILNDFPMRPS